MSEYIEKQELIDYLKYLKTADFTYITIDEAIRIVSERPTTKLSESIEYKFIKRNLKDSFNKVVELDTINKNLRLGIYKAIDNIEKEQKWLLNTGYNAYNIELAFNSITHILKQLIEK